MYETEISTCKANIKAYSDQIEALTEEISDLETYAERYSGKVGEVDGLKNSLLDQVRKICEIDAGLKIQEKINIRTGFYLIQPERVFRRNGYQQGDQGPGTGDQIAEHKN